MAAGRSGFLAYLGLSHAYYGGARKLFGATLFPAHEFGIVPHGAAGLALAATVYAVLGATVGWMLATVIARWRGPLGGGTARRSSLGAVPRRPWPATTRSTLHALPATLARWSAAGAGIGGAGGLLLLLFSFLGGGHTWAGMLLLSGVLSWPAGLWVFDPLTRAIQAGVPGAEPGSLVLGPVINGAVVGVVLGFVAWLASPRSDAPPTDPKGTA